MEAPVPEQKPLEEPLQQPQEMDQTCSDPQHQRMPMLQEAFSKCLRYGLRQPSVQEMRGFFPDLPEPVVRALLELYRQVLAQIEAHSQVGFGELVSMHCSAHGTQSLTTTPPCSVQAEFSDICKEYGMEAKLGEIDKLCAQAQASQQQPAETRSAGRGGSSHAPMHAYHLESILATV